MICCRREAGSTLREMADINPRFSQFQEYREAVRDLCGQFGSKYWQDIEEQSAYPEAFVKALSTRGGWRR